MISMPGLTLPQGWPQLFPRLKSLCLLGFSEVVSAVPGRTMPEHGYSIRGKYVDLVLYPFLVDDWCREDRRRLKPPSVVRAETEWSIGMTRDEAMEIAKSNLERAYTRDGFLKQEVTPKALIDTLVALGLLKLKEPA